MKRPGSSRARRVCGLALSLGMACGVAPAAASNAATAVAQKRQPPRPSNHAPEPVGKIAFSSERDGNYEIYVMNPDGGGQTRLTTNAAVDREPAFSPDGTRVAFTSDRAGAGTDIYVVSLAAPDTPFAPAARLTNTAGDDSQPAWSPDGTKIAFVSSRTGDDEIFVMNADGTGQTNLTSNAADDFDPAWSPDGSRLAFASNRESAGNEASDDIFTMNANGGGQTNVSRNAANERRPAWAGNRIAFQRTVEGQDDIFVMSPDGSNQTALTDDDAEDREPALSGDGSRFVFASNRDGDFEIYSGAISSPGAVSKLTGNVDDNDSEPSFERRVGPAPAAANSLLQFSEEFYRTSEDLGGIFITVSRTGDASGAAAVDYAVTSGSASERSDFTTAVGTLRFEPGAVSNFIHVRVTNDAFAEPAETINLTLSNPTGASLGPRTTAAIEVLDNDATTAAENPIDRVRFFITQHYLDFFNRDPDSEGFAAWQALLEGCPDQFNTDPTSQSVLCDRITFSSAFVRSPEYQQKGYYAIRFHLASLGRLPTYLEFVRDIQRLNALSAEQLAANQAAYAVEFTQRQDFRAIYDPLSNQAYVDRLAQTSGVSPANRAQLVADLNTGARTRAQVLREFVENPQFTAKEFNRGFVASQYYGYLRRDPEPAGFQDWLNFLNANPNDFRTMVNGFVNSREYRSRFGNP